MNEFTVISKYTCIIISVIYSCELTQVDVLIGNEYNYSNVEIS